MTYFVFCIHNHQPVGNFEHVLEESYQKSYWPFLKALSKHPAIKLSLHNSGFLLDWMIENHPEYISLLRHMVEARQVEIMGGGYYEPVLPVIPEEDRFNQITMMSDRIEGLFKTRPRGIWLAERVWEPWIPTLLKRAGIEYLLVDDYHFMKSGLTRDELGGYYISEDQGNVVKIFPGNERLRYLIPFRPVEQVEDYLKRLKDTLNKGNAAIYGDDGEKFGVWPGTHKWVFDDGWLENFFAAIEKNLDWLKPVSLGEYMDREDAVGQVYLPTTSYMEMGEWSLPAEASRTYTQLAEEVKGWQDGERVLRFLQGGTWRNFFSKYPEANWMHKRMLLVSRELRERMEGRPWDEHLSTAEKFLYRAQCNDAYWHGIFGGLYLPHLRTTIYENLIKAENITHVEMEFDEYGRKVTETDLDADNHKEFIVRTKELNLFLSPRNGGSLFELDHRPRAVNLSNTLSRWYEGYHYKLLERDGHAEGGGTKSIHEIVKVKEEGLERYLNYDKRRRASFVDHFLGRKETVEAFYANTHSELGDFHAAGYVAAEDEGIVTLSRHGHVNGKEVHVEKAFETIGANSFRVDYSVRAEDGDALTLGGEQLRFAVEMNFLLPCCEGPACQYRSPSIKHSDGIGLGTMGEVGGLDSISLVDTYSGILMNIETDKPATLWRFPVHTVSLSEDGFEKIFQGSCLVFLFTALKNEDMMKFSFKVRVDGIKSDYE